MRHDPSVSDVVWTTLITGGTAVLTGGLGWVGARQQTRVEMLKLKQERDPGTADNLKFRQDLYLRYLELTDKVWRWGTDGDGTADGFTDLFTEFQSADDEMELFAADAVISFRDAMWKVARAMLPDIDAATDAGAPFADGYATARNGLRADWMKARAELVQAIRRDVGPTEHRP